MEKQDWQGKQLDKDILVKGNKLYAPDTCIFVSSEINKLLSDCGNVRGKYPRGVNFNKATGQFRAKCRKKGVTVHLGMFDDAQRASVEYLKFKAQLVQDTAYESEAKSHVELQEALLRHSKYFRDEAKELENIINKTGEK